jgi:3-phenylpropionate/trans-cinnamate dioxygenase ferredoxin component
MDNRFVAVIRADSVAPGKLSKVVVDDKPYVVANVDGRFYAVEDNCSHEDYPLSYGCLDGDRIKCSLHGSRFSLITGEPMDAPADTPIRTVRCTLKDGWVWIDPTQSPP